MVNPETLDKRKAVESQILAVTVYGNQALVTRRGVVSLTGIEEELVVSPLPVTLESDSIRVIARGISGLKLLAVTSDRVYTTEPINEKLSELTTEIHKLELEKRHLQAQIDALSLQSSFISGLKDKTEEPFSQSLASKNLTISETLDFLNFLGSQYSEYAIAAADCKSQLQEVDKQLQIQRSNLQKMQNPASQESWNVVINIENTQPGELELEIVYMVNRVSWQPLYDLRVNSKEDQLHLSYLATITQNTGEDWQGVNLNLSTAKPGNCTAPPKLQPWYIDLPVPKVDESLQRSMLYPPAMALPMPVLRTPPKPVQPDVDDIDSPHENHSLITFKINGASHIPSDGLPYKTTIFQDNYPCRLEYVGIPRLVNFAYLQVYVKNVYHDVTLLPGKANIFCNSVFVGTTDLENVHPGQEFILNLGVEANVKIERHLVEMQVDKKPINNQNSLTYVYRLLITNLLDQSIKLQLAEQIPVSQNEQIHVLLVNSNPELIQENKGVLNWFLNIPPGEKQDIYYQFLIEYPSEATVVGLNI